MKIRKISIVLALGCLLCMLLAAFGCAKVQLEHPTGLAYDTETLTLTWDEVQNANEYVVDAGTQTLRPRKNSVSLAELGAGTFTVRVGACDRNGEYLDSEWSAPMTVTLDTETKGMQYTLSEDGSTYTLTSVLGTLEGEVVVESTYRGKPVTAIGKRAFARAEKITSVVIEEGISEIGDYAFLSCIGLQSVTFPDSVVELGRYAFQSCYALESITLPKNIIELKDYTFSFCSGLKNVTIPEGVLRVGKSAFNKCVAMEEIVLPDSLLIIDASVFTDCESLFSITLGAGVQYIGDGAFARCTALESLELPDKTSDTEGLLSLGGEAFYRCTALKEIELPDSLLVVGDSAFYGCTALDDIKMGKGVQRIGGSAFTETKLWRDATDFVYIGKWLVDCKDYESAVDETFTLLLRDDTVGIADYAFMNNDIIQMVVFPDALKYVGAAAFANNVELYVAALGAGAEIIYEQAFYGCTALQNFSTENNTSLRSIEDAAFYGCYDLAFSDDDKAATVVIPETVTNIGSYAFYYCEALKNIDLPDGLERIGMRAFNHAGLASGITNGLIYADNWIVGAGTGLGDIAVPNNIVGIADYVFFRDDGLTGVNFQEAELEHIGKGTFLLSGLMQSDSIVLPGTLERIEDYAFYACMYMKNVTLSHGTKEIGRSAFYASGLTSIVLPQTLESIGPYAFAHCIALKEIVIPASVKYIDDYAFAGCYSLERVIFAEGSELKEVGVRAFSECITLQSMEFGDKLEYVDDMAFMLCASLARVKLSDSLVAIGNRAFYKCASLNNVSFGNSLTSIGHYAFSNCTSLKQIGLPQSLEWVGVQAFTSCTALQSAYIPQTVSALGSHAFYNCPKLTLFTDGAALPEAWSEYRWNSSNLPVLLGCVADTLGGYLFSWTKGEVVNDQQKTASFTPARDGYTFVGWTTEMGGITVEYTADTVNTAPDGVTLYAIWTNV